MRAVISQSVVLPAAASALYHMYLDADIHEAITGAPVTISAETGAEFRAFEGALTGTVLAIVETSLIVQSWRSVDFKPTDPDSTLILSFTQQGDDGQIDLVHVDVPDHDYTAVTEGWEKRYWKPWRAYLATTVS